MNEMKGAYCSELYPEQLLIYNALKNSCRFRDRGQRLAVLAPFGGFVRKPKHEKNPQTAITRDWELISYFFVLIK